MRYQEVYPWKQAPSLRLLLPFAAGIMLQQQVNWPPGLCWRMLPVMCTLPPLLNANKNYRQYELGWISGLVINLLFTALGYLVGWYGHPPNRTAWPTQHYGENKIIIATITAPLMKKPASRLAETSIRLQLPGHAAVYSGRLLVYFKNDTPGSLLHVGSRVLFIKPPGPVNNPGNPGAFDYARYLGEQGISGQVFLGAADYRVLREAAINPLRRFIFISRETLLGILTRYIPGKKEAGLAEALLLGYKNDLDKALVRSYSSTGVVHIIAISGMHLALIYWLLNMALVPLKRNRVTAPAVPFLLVAGLWVFSLMAGGGASILRAAVMFTCIIAGQAVKRRTVIYNSLAVAALVLLCIHPAWLGDAGFQLSFAAVLSIVLFSARLTRQLIFSNKILRGIWQLVAVSTAAQLLTAPLCIFHFQQFPVFFLLSNMVAVPLSGLIILLLSGLCLVSFLPVVAMPAGLLLHFMIALMNRYIGHIEKLPFSLWSPLHINAWQVALLYGGITGLYVFTRHRYRPFLFYGYSCLLACCCIRAAGFFRCSSAHALVVYNFPRHTALDFIAGRKCFPVGDTALQQDPDLIKQAIAPARLLYRTEPAPSLPGLVIAAPAYLFRHRVIIMVDSNFQLPPGPGRMKVDLLVITGSASADLDRLAAVFACRNLV